MPGTKDGGNKGFGEGYLLGGDNLQKKHCDVIAEGDRVRVLKIDTCNAVEVREVIDVIVSNDVEEAVRCSKTNVESLGVAEIEDAEGNGLDTSIQQSGAGTGIGNINDSQANKGTNGPCQGEVIDPSATANDDGLSMGIRRTNSTSEREYIGQEDTILCTSDDQKVEKHCQIDDVHKEADISLIENGRCTVDNHTTLSDCTNQKGMDGPVNETKGDSTPDIVFIRRKSITRKTCEAKQVKSEDEVQFEKRVTRSATIRQREVSAGTCISATNSANLESKEGNEDGLHHYTRKVGSTLRSKSHHTDPLECGTDTKKKLRVTTQRTSGVTGKDYPASITQNNDSESDTKVNLKSQPLIRRGSIVNNTEEISISVGAKIVASKKRILESGLDKTGRESAVAIPSLKKARNASAETELEQPKKPFGKKITRSQTAELSTSVNCSNQKASKLSQNESDDDGTDSDTSLKKTCGRHTRSGDLVVPSKQEDSSESEEVIIVRKNQQKGKYLGQKQRAGSASRHPSGSSRRSHLINLLQLNLSIDPFLIKQRRKKLKLPKAREWKTSLLVQSDSEKQAFFSISTETDDPNDDTCGICGDGGNLICCDGCPSTFHMNCLELEALPSDDWRCAKCSCKFCQEHSSQDAQDIVEIDSSLCTCSQCEEKYHPACSSEITSTSCVSSQSGIFSANKVVDCHFPFSIMLFEELRNLLAVKKDLEPEFSCRIIQRIDEIIAAASVRIHGTKLAEMPFIGTRNMYRLKGMCRRLLNGIEMILGSLNVEKLIIPAIAELVDTWTSKFGFSPLDVSEKQEVKSVSMLVFPGTGLLQKSLLKNTSPEEHPEPQGVGVFSGNKSAKASYMTNEDSLCSVANAVTQGSTVTDHGDNSKDASACND
ncbi:hypothetical protein GUJ93_ZPchr0139g33506 [Zizania palustris]|uniref:PHD-type domain-containing protein n=1 Tax=Zizania palustris TaxID=103762 RepID=A0A8J5UVA6_ZIZPA|nr:hypothetical protein GUJ93_ZPchr0139g33506 [Zizania palustris]